MFYDPTRHAKRVATRDVVLRYPIPLLPPPTHPRMAAQLPTIPIWRGRVLVDKAMARALLADRFKLSLRIEKRELPVWRAFTSTRGSGSAGCARNLRSEGPPSASRN